VGHEERTRGPFVWLLVGPHQFSISALHILHALARWTRPGFSARSAKTNSNPGAKRRGKCILPSIAHCSSRHPTPTEHAYGSCKMTPRREIVQNAGSLRRCKLLLYNGQCTGEFSREREESPPPSRFGSRTPLAAEEQAGDEGCGRGIHPVCKVNSSTVPNLDLLYCCCSAA
jgi:hypothetical protein